MTCKIFSGIGIWFALANVGLIVSGVDNMALMQLFMEGCFIALFCAISCWNSEIKENQEKIIANQNTIIRNQK